MKNPLKTHKDICNLNRRFMRLHWLSSGAKRFAVAILALIACGLSVVTTRAATAVINPITQNYWTGINTSNVLGVGSNTVTFTAADASTFTLSVTGPSGSNPLLSTNAATNSILLGLFLSPTNVAAGAQSVTISGSGGSYPSYSTNVNLFVVPQWIQTNSGSIGNWSDGTKWSGGAAPASSDSVYIEHMIGAPFTNVVSDIRTIQSLIYLGDADDGSTPAGGVNTVIASGQTLSVVGTNGMFIGCKANNNTRPFYVFSGAGALVVSNASANFAVNDGCLSSSTRATTVNMSGLSNFVAIVSRFGAGDATLSAQGLVGGANVTLSLARTNTITTTWSDNYAALNFQNAFNFGNNGEQASGSVTTFLNLGVTNGIYTDSMGVGRSHLQGSSGVGATMRFLPALSNSVTPVASVYIRGTNGSRMPFLAVGVDSGSANSTKNTIGLVDLRGGKVDVLVDKAWLGANRTNTANPTDKGGLSFDNGTVNANIIEAGFMQYTNGALVSGTILVGTNGTLIVNTNLELGHTPSDNTGFPAALNSVSGQVTINGGGTLRANQITVGQFSTNNTITVNSGGLLVVSNTIAQPTNSLTTLSLDNAQLTFFVTGGITNAYVTNLTTTVNASKINIASVSGFASYPATNVLIAYQTAASHNLGVGSLPAGFNNMQIVDDTSDKLIELIINTNQPKNLAWRGGQNSQWDHISTNWIDLNLNAPTNVTKFTDGDSVTFDDTAAVPTNITIYETVLPGQTGTGMTVSNSVNSFTFNNSGAGSIGACVLVKNGTASLEIDPATSVAAQANNGTLIVGSSGTIGSATVAFSVIFSNAGTVSGGVTCAGLVQNAGSIDGAVAIQTSGIVTNSGTVNGNLSMQTGSLLYNAGTFYSIGSPTTPTNSTLVNNGTLYGSSLTVNGTLADTVLNSPGVSPGSINVGSLTINGTFQPGGNALGTTKVTDYASDGSTQLGNPNGRVQLSAGSTTIFQVNLTNAQPYTKLLSQNQGFGPSSVARVVGGGTLVITNVGPTPFSAGQTFKMFGAYYTDGNIGNAGLNTTNSYPVIQPKTPGAGLAWDLSQLIPGGTIGVISAPVITLSNNVTVAGTNIITELSWPADYIGYGWVQQQITTLTNGLGTNWSNVGSSDYVNDLFLTNDVTGPTAVFYRFVLP